MYCQYNVQIIISLFRNVQLDAINRYMTIWNNYESHYHDSIKAKQYLELKTELQTLHSLSKPSIYITQVNGMLLILIEDSLDEDIQSLTAHVSTDAQIESWYLICLCIE